MSRSRGTALDRREFVTTCACLLAGGLVSACASLATRPVPIADVSRSRSIRSSRVPTAR